MNVDLFPKLYIFTCNLYLTRSPQDKKKERERQYVLRLGRQRHIDSCALFALQALDSLCFLAKQKPDLGEESFMLILEKPEEEQCYVGISPLPPGWSFQVRNFRRRNMYLGMGENQGQSTSKV